MPCFIPIAAATPIKAHLAQHYQLLRPTCVPLQSCFSPKHGWTSIIAAVNHHCKTSIIAATHIMHVCSCSFNAHTCVLLHVCSCSCDVVCSCSYDAVCSCSGDAHAAAMLCAHATVMLMQQRCSYMCAHAAVTPTKARRDGAGGGVGGGGPGSPGISVQHIIISVKKT